MSDSSTREKIDTTRKESGPIYCKRCGCAITAESCRIVKEGSSVHTFLNPAGIVYTIGCFSRAPGGRKIGDYSFEFSWFDGYAWCYLVCGACLEHLGWHYSGPGERDFHGLILEKLTAD